MVKLIRKYLQFYAKKLFVHHQLWHISLDDVVFMQLDKSKHMSNQVYENNNIFTEIKTVYSLASASSFSKKKHVEITITCTF